MDEIYDKLNDALTSREIHRLFGDVTYKYEMMRFNGTPAMVKGIYGHDIKKNDDVPYIGNNQDPYIQEKTRKFYDAGSPFATRLDSGNIVNLGAVLYNYIRGWKWYLQTLYSAII